ncbi:MAG: transposase, partial [Prevotella sp.]|nr:transposase [Prevotella sp.]
MLQRTHRHVAVGVSPQLRKHITNKKAPRLEIIQARRFFLNFITNTDLDAERVIAEYHGLWVVERAFRISKGTLEMRPMFHFTERRIEAHVCICFIAYKVYKELERL